MKFTQRFSIIMILVFVQTLIFGQGHERPLDLSALAGDTLRATNKQASQLFPELDGLQWAVFDWNEDSTMSAKVCVFQNGKRKHIVVQRFVTLASLQDQVEGAVSDSKHTADPFAAERGAEVEIILSSGQLLSGRLFSVRESTLVISTENKILLVKNQDIHQVVIVGESRIFQSMGAGVVIGSGIGAMLGLATREPIPFSQYIERENGASRAVGGAIALSSVGFIIGTIVGILISESDVVVEPLRQADFSSLKPLARFPVAEPEYLQAIK